MVSTEFDVKDDENLIVGDVVTIGDDGMITKRTGTTIYKNEHKFKNKVMLNLHAVALDDITFASVYQGGMVLVRLDANDKVTVEYQVRQ